MKITMDGKYTTRDGRPVRILCVDGNGRFPVVGIIDDREAPDCWEATGDWGSLLPENAKHDLIPAKPEPVVEWGFVDHEGTFRGVSCEQAMRSIAGVGHQWPMAKRTTTTEIIEP